MSSPSRKVQYWHFQHFTENSVFLRISPDNWGKRGVYSSLGTETGNLAMGKDTFRLPCHSPWQGSMIIYNTAKHLPRFFYIFCNTTLLQVQSIFVSLFLSLSLSPFSVSLSVRLCMKANNPKHVPEFWVPTSISLIQMFPAFWSFPICAKQSST